MKNKKCDEDKILNPKTNRYVLRRGKIGQEILKNTKSSIILSVDNKKNGARQNHGFLYEEYIIKKYNLIKEKSYIGKYDAYKHTKLKNIPVQIKYIAKQSSIDMGDYFRNKNKSDEFILIIGLYTNKDDFENAEEYILHIEDFEKWNNMFEFKYDKELKVEMSLISNLKVDDQNWKNYCNKYKKYWNEIERHIQLRFKRDHKTQKRIQCAINRVNFKKYFLNDYKLLTPSQFLNI
jgi:hypothetical protein